MPRGGPLFLWCIHTLHIFLPADTGDFLADDDYQGITNLHNLYAWSRPHYTCDVYTHFMSFFLLDTSDFLANDDYQGITKLHNLYA